MKVWTHSKEVEGFGTVNYFEEMTETEYIAYLQNALKDLQEKYNALLSDCLNPYGFPSFEDEDMQLNEQAD